MELKFGQITFNFSVKSPFSQETYKKCESLSQKEKSKHLSIKQGEKLLIKLHGDILLQDDFPETFSLFDLNSDTVSIPEDFNVENLEILVNFFYLREISTPLSIQKTFGLLDLAVFFKVFLLVKEIKAFLLASSNKIENAFQIVTNSLNSYLLFQSSNFQSLEVFNQLLSQSITFLIKNNKTEDILKNFNMSYFNRLQNSQIVEKSFNFFVDIFKASVTSNEALLDLLVRYKDRLIQYFKIENANFNKERYYQRFIERNLDLTNLNIKNIRDYLEKLDIEGNIETKDLMISAMSDNITACKREVNELKNKVSSMEYQNRAFELQFQIFKGESENEKINLERKNCELEQQLKEENKNRQIFEQILTTLLISIIGEYVFVPESIRKGTFSLSNFNTMVEKF